MDSFDCMKNNTLDTESPLASRLRLAALDEVVGQKYIVDKGKLLYRAVQVDQLGSIIFYRLPGIGKTTLAKIIANTIRVNFRQINATTAGKKDMEEVIKEAKDTLRIYGKKIILFVDEMHCFNKSQRDYLLPFMEDGAPMLIGATTENPYFEVNGALISRSHISELKALKEEDIKELPHRAVYDREKGMGSYNTEIEDDALEFLADVSNSNARAVLNAIELGILITERGEDGKIHTDLEVAQECIQKRVVRYDEDGDNHYDIISALTKNMRGFDPDVVVYYLARTLYAGEDIKLIARRIMVCAAEDVDIVDPTALMIVVSASQAVEWIGIPEAQTILSQAVLYVATTLKSSSVVVAVSAAMDAVKSGRIMSVSVHLQGRYYKGAEKLGHRAGYLHAHDYPNHYVKQQYLSDGMGGVTFYHPSDNGHETQIQEYSRRVQNQLSFF